MTTAEVDFSCIGWRSVEWTHLVTLYLRADESRPSHPILGDHAAEAAVQRIDYDVERVHRGATVVGAVLGRVTRQQTR
jgi:O-methyltransferase involved in polyketide biosynthesis